MFMILWDFWWMSKFSFHHKWNEAWLLLVNWYIRVASQVAENLGNLEISGKSQIFIVIASSLVLLLKLKFCRTGKNLLKYRNWTSPAVCYLQWKIEFVSNILWIISGRWRFSDILVSDKKISILFFSVALID